MNKRLVSLVGIFCLLLIAISVSAGKAPIMVPAGVAAATQTAVAMQSPLPTLPGIGIAQPACDLKDITSAITKFLQSSDKSMSITKLNDAQKRYFIVEILDTTINSGSVCATYMDCNIGESCRRSYCAQSNTMNWYIFDLGADKKISTDDKLYLGDSNTIDQSFFGELTATGANKEKLFYLKQKTTSSGMVQEIWSCDLPTCTNKNLEASLAKTAVEGLLPSAAKNRMYIATTAGVFPNQRFEIISCSFNPTAADACKGNELSYRTDVSTQTKYSSYFCNSMSDAGIVHTSTANLVNTNSYCDQVFEIATETDHDLLSIVPMNAIINKIKPAGGTLAFVVYTIPAPSGYESYITLVDLVAGPLVTVEKIPQVIGTLPGAWQKNAIYELNTNQNPSNYIYLNYQKNMYNLYTKKIGQPEKKILETDGVGFSKISQSITMLADGTVVGMDQKLYSLTCTP